MKGENPKRDHSLSERVYRAVYGRIVSGKLKPGEKITEAGISAWMGVSRAPVREALKRLAEDRLVVLVPRSGCFVADVGAEEIEEIYEIRKRLESMALEYAFERLDVERARELKNKFTRCRRLGRTELVRTEIQLDSRLHNLIAQASGCENLQEMLGKLRARMQIFRVREADYIDRAKAALTEHLAILRAILDGDKNKAIKRLAAHIEQTKKNVLKHLRSKKSE